MRTYSKHFSTKATPQSEPVPSKKMVKNNAEGYGFAVDDWVRLERFLILGSEGGTYYVTEKELTIRNATAVQRCIKSDGMRVVDTLVEISQEGRAPKNDPALFVLAMCASLGDDETRKMALGSLPKVARIGTHLFHFLEYAKLFRGWGRGLREAVSKWYNDKPADRLAYQVVKYRQRDGWTHRDALRLAHPQPFTPEHDAIYQWIVSPEKYDEKGLSIGLVDVFNVAQSATDKRRICALIREEGLTREMIPTQFLSEPQVWEALLEKMPMTAMIRNLGNMSKVGLLKTGNWDAINTVVERLADKDRLKKSRIHPLSVLAALHTYSAGRGFRGRGEWNAVPQIVDALDAAFYTCFGNVEPTNKSIVLALDISGSMTWGNIAGVGGITPRVGSAAMALVTANVERRHAFVGFSRNLIPLNISPRQRLDDVCKYLAGLPFGGTDCAQPMIFAMKEKYKVDTFVIYTDSETWAGEIHPFQALQEYRRKVNPSAKLVVVGMVSNEFTIADPDDAGMMDVVGFSTATPNVISDFARR